MSVELKDITYVIKGKTILDDVSFHVEDKELVSLLGASGAGKTTTIRIIAGILAQTDGSVLIDNSSVDLVPANKRKVSIAFQDMRLFPNMSVGENVAFSLRMQGMKKKERIERADEYLEMVQLAGFGTRKVQELSGGQQQRVALARAVAANPRVLLLDEPFSGLDENLRDGMRNVVRDLHRKLGLTTIMITHDAVEALTMSDHIVYLRGGRVIQYATPDELYSNPIDSDVALCFGNACCLEGSVSSGVFSSGDFLEFSCNCESGLATAVLRYDGIRFNECDNDHGVIVSNCLFGGENYRVSLDLGGETLMLETKNPAEVGSRVSLSFESGSCFVYPRKEEQTDHTLEQPDKNG